MNPIPMRIPIQRNQKNMCTGGNRVLRAQMFPEKEREVKPNRQRQRIVKYLEKTNRRDRHWDGLGGIQYGYTIFEEYDTRFGSY
jgi:hypothetical protein